MSFTNPNLSNLLEKVHKKDPKKIYSTLLGNTVYVKSRMLNTPQKYSAKYQMYFCTNAVGHISTFKTQQSNVESDYFQARLAGFALAQMQRAHVP